MVLNFAPVVHFGFDTTIYAVKTLYITEKRFSDPAIIDTIHCSIQLSIQDVKKQFTSVFCAIE